MTEDIIRMAREAGCEIRNGHAYNPHTGSLDQMLKRFAALVRADERERIAAEWDGHMYGDTEDIDIGAAIRARKP